MKMDWLRTSLIAAIAVVCFILMIRWTQFQEQQLKAVPTDTKTTQTSTAEIPAVNTDTPSSTTIAGDAEVPVMQNSLSEQEPTSTATANTISIETDVLNLTIDLLGGNIIQLSLPTYYAELHRPDLPYELLKNSPSETYVANSGLIGRNGTDTPAGRPLFQASRANYVMQENEETLQVDLHYSQSSEVNITKRFTFTRASHLIDIQYIVDNQSQSSWQAVIYGQIKRNDYNPIVSAGLGMSPYLGAATTTNDKNYKKISFSDIKNEKVEFTKQGGWVAMVQHYFFSAWIPNPEDQNDYELTKSTRSDNYILQFKTPALVVPPQSEGSKTVSFYAGPKDIKTLETISPYLDLTVDYGFLWWIAKPLFYGLDLIHDLVGNWGIAIILLTMCIKALFFYPSAASYRSMAKMRKVQPKMAELKERFGDNKQKFSAEMMKLYREEKVNPLGGCLPILIQMPVFISLYWVLMESVELRQAPLFLWIHDLSVKDPYFVLPLIMGVTMFIQQKLNPTPPDPMQAKVMQMMPIFFTFLFLVFPAGLVLYWVVNNTLSIIQQYVITKQIENSK